MDEKKCRGNIILIIDDDDLILSMSKLILESQLPCKVLLADNGLDGLDILSRQYVSVVLLDTAVPFLDGFETLAQIKANKKWRNIPVVMMSDSADRNEVLRAARYGIKGYVTKPFMPEELVRNIKKHINFMAADLLALIIDDDEHDRMAAKIIIEESSLPFKVEMADSGLAGLTLMHEHHIDLVLIAFDMDWMDGLRTADFIYADESLQDTSMVFMVESTLQEIMVGDIGHSAVKGCIKKPFVPEDFVAKLNNMY